MRKRKLVGDDVSRVQEARSPGRDELAVAGYRTLCREVGGGKERAGQHGVGLVIKELITNMAGAHQQASHIEDFQHSRRVEQYHICTCHTPTDIIESKGYRLTRTTF